MADSSGVTEIHLVVPVTHAFQSSLRKRTVEQFPSSSISNLNAEMYLLSTCSVPGTAPGSLHSSSPFISTVTLQGSYLYHPCFINGKTKAQRVT